MLNRIINNEGSGTGEWTLLSRIIWLKATVLAAAGAAWHTVTGAIVQFVAPRAHPLKSLTVTLEPQQDLHGQSSPYPAGGGTNKFDGETVIGRWRNDGTFDNTATNWTSSKNPIPVVSGQSNYINMVAYRIYYDASMNFVGYDGNGTNVATTPADAVYMHISQSSNEWINDIVVAISSSAVPYSPYSNICPIIGWTECEVNVRSKNLFDFKSDYSDWADGYIMASGNPSGGAAVPPSYERTSPFIPVKGGQDYTLSYTPNTSSQLSNNCAFYDADKNFISGTYWGAYNISQYTRTAPENAAYFRFSCRTYNSATEYQLELGSTATDFETFRGETINVEFPDGTGAVYGGTLDVVSGKLTIDRKSFTVDDTLTWRDGFWVPGNRYYAAEQIVDAKNNQSCQADIFAKGVISIDAATQDKQIDVRISSSLGVFSTLLEWITYLANNPVQIIYELDAPIEIQLTPQQVNALIGTNVVWADAGDVSVTFRGTPIEEPDAEPLQALNLLLGGAYRNNQTQDDVSDEEALDILLGGADR